MVQVGEIKVALTNTEFKGKCCTCGKYGHKQNKYLKKNKSEEEKGNKTFQASATTVVRWGIRPSIAGNMRLIKTRDPRIGRRKKKRT